MYGPFVALRVFLPPLSITGGACFIKYFNFLVIATDRRSVGSGPGLRRLSDRTDLVDGGSCEHCGRCDPIHKVELVAPPYVTRDFDTYNTRLARSGQ